MKPIEQKIESLKKELKHSLEKATTQNAIEQIRVAFLGRNGSITMLMKSLKTFSVEQKRTYGPPTEFFKK